MLTYQIRGGLGTQLLNLMAAYGDAFEKGKDIEKIVLNFFNYPDGLREQQVISWNLPFQTYQQCQMFYNQNATNLKDGVVVHGNSQ